MASESVTDDARGDPDGTRLFARVCDKIDKTLFAHGMAFREDEDHEAFCEQLAALLYKYYDDQTGGDSSYDPAKPPDSDSSDDMEQDEDGGESESESLTEDSPRPTKKQKAQK